MASSPHATPTSINNCCNDSTLQTTPDNISALAPTETVCPLFAFMLSFVFVGLTCAFGFIGNSLSIATLNRDRTNWKTVTHFLLTVLAGADIAFLVPVIVVIVLPIYCSYFNTLCSKPVSGIIRYIEQYGWSVASAAHMTTVYITVLVAFHRYVYVCRPYDTNRLSGIRRAKIHVVAVPIFALLFNLPRLFEYEQSDKHNVTLHSPPRLVFSDMGKSTWFRIAYKNVCFYLFMYIIPLGVLLFVSFRLVQTLRRRKQHRFRAPKTSRQQDTKDNKVTFVLIIVIVVFIVCQTPTAVNRLILALAKEEGLVCGQPYNNLERSADYLVVFNSCVNFVVYVLFAGKFRQILVSDILRFGGGRRRRSDGGSSGGSKYCNEFAECFAASSIVSADLPQRQQHQMLQQQLQQQWRTQMEQPAGRVSLLQLPEPQQQQSQGNSTSGASGMSTVSNVSAC